MGVFNRMKRAEDLAFEEVEYLKSQMEEPEMQTQLIAFLTFVVIVLSLRFFSGGRLRLLAGEHVLDIRALNDVSMFKEVFLAYLNAAVLEPILSIGGMEETKASDVIINIFTLGSICWWIWLLTDAFDFTDVMQHYKFHVELREDAEKDPKRFSWLRLKSMDEDAIKEKKSLAGTLTIDVALWLSIACIGAAILPGVVTHRDAMHAYVVFVLWAILHHLCRKATCWSSGYLVTFLFPSTALMPLEYCFPLMDVADTVEDLAFVEVYREFVIKRTGVELIIES